ncbi:MAG: family 10 glycosylhydrolase [Pseudonocardiaceae bacterium]|nr:family 10 glycosylhydrolase [Pseudonocardiaceae bacterium]
MRAVWISSVENIDWPSSTDRSPDEQRAELTKLYDQAKSNNLNSVFVQIRPTADAFWPSPHEPWSHWLTGTQGKDPGYDPLKFAVDEAHKRGLEFHGWFNPYRVAMHTDTSKLAPEHPARVHPDWTFKYDGKLYYNPGIPEVREFVQTAMMDAVRNYDLDGVHFDDYFYPYPSDGESIPDQQTFEEHGGDFDNIEDWRRNNVDLLVKEMGEKIHAAKPDVQFGISPFGIWRNSSTDPNGSDTSGLESYDQLFADTRKWVKEGYLDYINPQVYWPIGHSAADYAKLVPWWSNVVDGTGVKLYIGQPAYRIGEEGYDNATLTDHLTFNKDYPQVRGDVYFSATSLKTNAADAMARVVENHYTEQVPPPSR